MQELPSVMLHGMQLAALNADELLSHVFAELSAGRGGWLVTANLDFMRRYAHEPSMRSMYDEADVRVADGMPLVWASALQGTPLPERVAGSSLLVPLCERAEREGRSVYLLGGDPAANDAATARLSEQYPALKIAGHEAPWVSSEPTFEELALLRDNLTAARPDLVLVAFGSPKQEKVIAALRDSLPGAWWAGIGISLSFYAGHVKRAPVVLQRLGLEWAHRLAQEPGRLFRRYVVEDLPFAFELFTRAGLERLKR